MHVETYSADGLGTMSKNNLYACVGGKLSHSFLFSLLAMMCVFFDLSDLAQQLSYT